MPHPPIYMSVYRKVNIRRDAFNARVKNWLTITNYNRFKKSLNSVSNLAVPREEVGLTMG